MVNIYTEVIGRDNFQPLVLLHGWGWNSAIWRPLIPLLTEKFQVFLIDLPGHGQSTEVPTDYSFETIVPAILAKTPLGATWCGWSLGGLLAYWVAIHFPSYVSRLVTVASSPCFMTTENWPGLQPQALEKFSQQLALNHEQTLRDFLELQLRGSSSREELLVTLHANGLLQKAPEFQALVGGLELLKKTDLRAKLGKISCPNLHIFGQLDTIVPAGVAVKLPEFLQESECVTLRRTGHMPFLGQKELFVEKLIKSIKTRF